MKWRVSMEALPRSSTGRFPAVVSMRAPKARSCAATGSIGRRRRDPSPSNLAAMPAPAQAPSNIRAVEPEFMQSSVRGALDGLPGYTTASSPRLSIPNTELAQRVARRPDVAPGIQIRNAQRFVAARADDECPMGDGFVPGNADAAAQTARVKGYRQQESFSVA